jgi:hypothetical protein
MIKLGGVSFIHQVPNLHIFSFSEGDLDPLKQAMCIDAHDPYSACVAIDDPQALLNSIYAGEILKTKAAVRTVFKEAGGAAVAYEAVTQDILAGPVIPPSPFKKAPHFAPQCEVRFVFGPASEDSLEDRIVIKLPDGQKHFSEVFRNFKA